MSVMPHETWCRGADRDCDCGEQERRDRLAEFEAAPDAEESLRERVARAMWASHRGVPWNHCEFMGYDDDYRAMADAAIAVMRGGQP